MNKEQQQIIMEAYENYIDKLLFNEIDCYCDTELNKPTELKLKYKI